MTITSMEGLTALDDGTQVRSNGRRWTREGDFWVNSEFRLLTDQMRPDVEAGRVSLVTTPTGGMQVTDWNIGDSCGTAEVLDRLPVGTRLRFRRNGHETATLQDDGQWLRADSENHYTRGVMMQEDWVLDALPEGYFTADQAPAHLMPGQQVTSGADLDALPVGSTIRYTYRENAGHVYTKSERGWHGESDGVATDPFARDGAGAARVLGVGNPSMGTTTVESVPGVVMPTVVIGQEVRGRTAMNLLPTGVGLRYRGGEERIIRNESGDWVHRDRRNVYADNQLDLSGWLVDLMPETTTLPAVGERFDSGETAVIAGIYDAMPVGTVVTVPGVGDYTKDGSGMWATTTTGRTARASAHMARSFRGVTVRSYPVGSSTGVTFAQATGTTAAPAVNPTQVIQGLDPETVQEALHSYLADMDGLSEHERSGILSMLDDFGLNHPEPERGDVNIEVEVSGTWTDYHDDIFRDHIGGGASVDNGHLEVCWTNSVTITLSDRPLTECSCEDVDLDVVKSALRDEGMDSDCVEASDIDFTCSCEND